MNIRADDGTRFEVQYTMFLNADRHWKLKNLYIEGVNLRRQPARLCQADSIEVNVAGKESARNLPIEPDRLRVGARRGSGRVARVRRAGGEPEPP